MENTQTRKQQWQILIYFVAFLLAAALRFIRLGALPMGDFEAGNALQALQLANGGTPVIGGQPGYVVLTSFLFFTFGHSEFWARLWPALFGAGLIFTPLLFKRWIGENASLILALFFAIEPGFIALSRTSTGTMIALVGLLAAFGFLLNKKPVLAGIFTGIALLGGVAIWAGLVGLGLSFLLFLLFQRRQKEHLRRKNFMIIPKLDWSSFLLSASITLVLISTGFFFHSRAISGLGTSLVDYFQSWFAKGTGVSIKVMVLALIGEQFMAILLGIWGAIRSWKLYKPITLFMVLWVLVSTGLIFMNSSRQIVDWAWTLLPLWLLAALGLEELIKGFSRQTWILKLFQSMATVALLVFSFLNFLSLVTTTNPVASKTNAILGIILPMILLVVITILIGWGWSPQAASQGFLLGLGLILVVVSFGTAWKGAGLGPRPEAELWRSDGLPVGRDLLMNTVDNLSLWNTTQKNGIDIVLLNEKQSALQWVFRDFTGLQEKDIIGDSETPSLLISSVNNPLTSAQLYRGQAIDWTATPNFASMTAKDWVDWFTFREVPLTTNKLILWARNDLFKN